MALSEKQIKELFPVLPGETLFVTTPGESLRCTVKNVVLEKDKKGSLTSVITLINEDFPGEVCFGRNAIGTRLFPTKEEADRNRKPGMASLFQGERW